MQCQFVQFFQSGTLLRRYVSSKVEPSFVEDELSFIEDIRMAAGFGGVRQYVGELIFMYKVTSKITFEVLLEGESGFMKNAAVRFSVPKQIYEWPLNVLELSMTQLGLISVAY